MRLIVVASLIAFPVWIVTLLSLWRGRRWLVFYLVGALGAVVFVMLLLSITGWDQIVEALEARQVLALAERLGLTLVVLGENGLAIKNHTGWGVFDIGVECSALMEMSVMAGLILFYPVVFSAGRKVAVIAVGTVMTYLFNLLRILFIVWIVASFGTDWVFPAHAVFGRLLFFVLTVALYWRLITLPTVRHIGLDLGKADE
jgi:exosortase family protein XrtG